MRLNISCPAAGSAPQSFWLFAHRSFPINAVGLFFWIIYGINRVGKQEVF